MFETLEFGYDAFTVLYICNANLVAIKYPYVPRVAGAHESVCAAMLSLPLMSLLSLIHVPNMKSLISHICMSYVPRTNTFCL